MRRSLIAILSASALTACAAGPDFVAPLPPPAASGPFQSTAAFQSQSAAVTTAAPADDHWWRLYNDPVLDELVADALAANTDVRAAVARIARARAALREVRSDRLPQTGISAGGNYTRYSTLQSTPGAPRQGWVVDGGLDVSYEVDLFGRVSRGVEAARGDLNASQADANAVRVTVAAETARAYADAASAAERLAVAQRIVDLLDKSVALTAHRTDVGLTTPLDTARITALREQRRADIAAIAAERQTALFRLATLTGRAPADLPAIAAERVTSLRLSQPIPVGDGQGLLARRPDVHAAEQRLAATTARIGVATAALYPQIKLGGSIGQTSAGFTDFFGGGPLRWLAGPLISWNFPNQQAARARIAEARADSQEALANFDGTVLRALQESETALSNYAHLLDQRTALQAARDQAERAVRITRAQMREGQIDGLVATDAERTFAEAEAALALADAQIADAQVDVFRALGGGWQQA